MIGARLRMQCVLYWLTWPEELNYLSVCGELVFGGGSAAQRAMHTALAGDQSSGTTGFGADTLGGRLLSSS